MAIERDKTKKGGSDPPSLIVVDPTTLSKISP